MRTWHSKYDNQKNTFDMTTKIPLSCWKGQHLPSFADHFLDSDVPEYSWGYFHGYDGRYQGDDGHCHGVAP